VTGDAQAALLELARRVDMPAAPGRVELRWGALYAALGGPHTDYVAAIELMYEGYLLHYRESRALAVADDEGETALLAGDSAYAEGLRAVARRNDVVSVRLLARLMSACAFLRDEGLPFVHDDALWAYTVAAMAAGDGAAAPPGAEGDGAAARPGVETGVRSSAVREGDGPAKLFDDVDEAFRDGRGDQVADLVAAAVPGLRLRDAAPLLAALTAEGS